MGNTRIRAGFRAAAAIAAFALPLAAAGNAFAAPKGDNGDVKIHDITTHADVEANNPHVCKFYLDAFNFDAVQQVHWEIDGWAGSDSDDTKGALAAQGDITLKADGTGQTAQITLPDDHYKLFWTFVGENGKAKHKVFWVDCGSSVDLIGGVTVSASGGSSPSSHGGGSTSGGTNGDGSTSGGSTGGTTTHPTATSSASTPKSAGSTSAPAAGATSPSTTSTGKLAHTGAEGSALIYAVVGAAVLAGGGYGLRRYATTRGKA